MDSASRFPVPTATASVIVPAHNEERVISRTLTALLEGSRPGEFEILVVCNGCTDDTRSVAADFEPAITVVEIAEASKQAALRTGDRLATVYPRIYVDADVEISGTALRALVGALDAQGVEVAAPERKLGDPGSWVVRAYYRVWEQLPQVRDGVFGRGVIALSARGHARILALPQMMSDDLAISEAFTPRERLVLDDAEVIVYPARTLASLLRRRIRVATGNAQMDHADRRGGSSRTSIASLVHIVAERPRLLPALPVFLGVTLAARLAAVQAIRRGDYETWLRDESSRP